MCGCTAGTVIGQLTVDDHACRESSHTGADRDRYRPLDARIGPKVVHAALLGGVRRRLVRR
jgi:hypothetical protein